MTPTASQYPQPGQLAAAQLLGRLHTDTHDDALLHTLAAVPAETWPQVLAGSAAAVGYGAVLRLTASLGAVVLTGGAAGLVTGGAFDRACELASVDPHALTPPQVAWQLTSPAGPRLGFPIGTGGGIAAVAAASVLTHRLTDTRHPLHRPVTLTDPNHQPVDLAAAGSATAHMPAAWVAAAQLFGAVAVLDTWVPATCDPRPVLAALYPGTHITHGPHGWSVGDTCYHATAAADPDGFETRWTTTPIPAT